MSVINLISLTLCVVLFLSGHYSLFEVKAAAVAPTKSSPDLVTVPQSSNTLETPRSNRTRPAAADGPETPDASIDAPVSQAHYQGTPAEEIALYVCIGLGVLLFAVCCYFCSKHCWCPTTRRPTAVVYRHMTIPASVNIFTRQQDERDGFGLLRADVSPSVMRRVSPIRTEDIVLATLPTIEELEKLYRPHEDHEGDPPPPYNHKEARNQSSSN